MRLLSAVKACFTGTRTRCNKELTMPSPNLPPGFDPTDPDINVEGLPIEEFAELRKAAPIWWCEHDPGSRRRVQRRRLLGGHQAQGRQRDLPAQRRLLQLRKRRDPALQRRHRSRGHRGPATRDAQHGRAASHPAAQDHLPRVHPAGRRPVARRAERAGAEDRQDGGVPGRRRLRRAGVVRAAAAGHRRSARRARRRTATSSSAGPTR